MAAARLGRPLCELTGVVCSAPGATPRVEAACQRQQRELRCADTKLRVSGNTSVLCAVLTAARTPVPCRLVVCTHLSAALRQGAATATINLPAVCTELTVHLERLRKVWLPCCCIRLSLVPHEKSPRWRLGRLTPLLPPSLTLTSPPPPPPPPLLTLLLTLLLLLLLLLLAYPPTQDGRLSDWREENHTSTLAAKLFTHAESIGGAHELLATHGGLQSVLGEAGLLQMFPLLAETLCGVPDTHEGTTAGDYLKKIAALNQLVAVAEQLRRDAATHATQKYLAHQIALLYVRCHVHFGS